MGKIKRHLPVKSFAAIAYNDQINLESVLSIIQNLFGKIDKQSAVYDYDSFTNYYTPELGVNLKKLFISFEQLIAPESLPDLKIKSNNLEIKYKKSAKRVFNIDPGYLTQAKVVLATTKDYSHRLYLGQGIYGDLHLYFSNKSLQAQPWTYPDYKQELAVNFFNELRQIYNTQLGEMFLSDKNNVV